MLDAFHRLISLLDEAVVIPQLAALIQQEIIIRLLMGTHAAYLWNLVNATSPTQQIARAISWIRQNLAEEMRVGDLAEHANMSLTTFRERFRSVTGMSPVQFQKMLRLQEARSTFVLPKPAVQPVRITGRTARFLVSSPRGPQSYGEMEVC